MRLLAGFVIGWAAAVLLGAGVRPAVADGKTEECTTYGFFTGKKYACTEQEKAALIASGAGR